MNLVPLALRAQQAQRDLRASPALRWVKLISVAPNAHNETTLIWSKEAQFRENSVHGTGEAFIRGETTACAGCHGTEGAKARINAGGINAKYQFTDDLEFDNVDTETSADNFRVGAQIGLMF